MFCSIHTPNLIAEINFDLNKRIHNLMVWIESFTLVKPIQIRRMVICYFLYVIRKEFNLAIKSAYWKGKCVIFFFHFEVLKFLNLNFEFYNHLKKKTSSIFYAQKNKSLLLKKTCQHLHICILCTQTFTQKALYTKEWEKAEKINILNSPLKAFSSLYNPEAPKPLLHYHKA